MTDHRRPDGSRQRRPAATPLLPLEDVHTYYGTHPRPPGHRHRGRAGRDRHAHRGQRRRQDDDPQDHQRAAPPAPGHGGRSRARTSRRRRRTQLVSAGIGHAPGGPPDLLAPDRPREPPDGRLHPRPDRDRPRTSTASWTLFPRLRERTAPAGRDAVGRRAADARDRAGADVASRGCCCSTSRRSASRRSSSSRSSRSSARSTSRARRSCSSSRTRSRRCRSRIAATCSRPARSCSPGRPRSSAERDGPQGVPRRGLNRATGVDDPRQDGTGRLGRDASVVVPVAPSGGSGRIVRWVVMAAVLLAVAVLKPWGDAGGGATSNDAWRPPLAPSLEHPGRRALPRGRRPWLPTIIRRRPGLPRTRFLARGEHRVLRPPDHPDLARPRTRRRHGTR